MKRILLYILAVFSFFSADAQYYLRGEIKNSKGEPLQNVKMLLLSSRSLYYSGSSGGFGISLTTLTDSMSFCADGYESKTINVNANDFQEVVLKELSSNTSNGPKLVSVTQDMDRSASYSAYQGDESYFSLVENQIIDAKKYPNTGFSMNVDKASYSNIRRFINMNSEVPPDAVRIEELLNYFNLHYHEPEGKDVFKVESHVSDCPWNEKHKLLYVNVNARKLNLDNVPPCNLVFLIDGSGSMDMPNKLPLVKAAFQMLVKNLRPIDTISIVVYGGSVSICLKPTSGADKQTITKAIEEIVADGDTPGEAAIRAAYKVAEQSFIKKGNNRIILATDGDFNVGETSEQALEDLITNERKSGVYLTCLGVGMGNYKDSKLEALARKGNGNYAYLDNINEAEKVLVKEMTQTFYVVADNVFLNVHFNENMVKDYRLIGFDNKKDAIADSTGQLEGGEVGSGNSVLAIFEITPVSANIFSANSTCPDTYPAQVSVRYNMCNDTSFNNVRYDCPNNYVPFNALDKDLQFGAALTMFGMKLRQSKYMGTTEWSDIETIAANSRDPNDYLQKEFVQMVINAKKIYTRKKKKGEE